MCGRSSRSHCFGLPCSGVKMGVVELGTYDELMKGGHHGKARRAGQERREPALSDAGRQGAPDMPMDGSKLAAGEIEIVRKWIDAARRALPRRSLRRCEQAVARIATGASREAAHLRHGASGRHDCSRWLSSKRSVSRSRDRRNHRRARRPRRSGARRGVFARRQAARRCRRPARRAGRSQDLGRRRAKTGCAPSTATADCIYAVAFSPETRARRHLQLRQADQALGRRRPGRRSAR